LKNFEKVKQYFAFTTNGQYVVLLQCESPLKGGRKDDGDVQIRVQSIPTDEKSTSN